MCVHCDVANAQISILARDVFSAEAEKDIAIAHEAEAVCAGEGTKPYCAV